MRPHSIASLPDFIKSHVDTSTGCWIWQRAKLPDGYGVIRAMGRGWRVHCLMWTLVHGPIPPGLHVLHNCPNGDNPACCNPDHLWLGTHADNMRDRTMKGRGPRLYGDANVSRRFPERLRRGEECHSAKLTADDVRMIRQMYAEGQATQVALAQRFGIRQCNISAIVRRTTWKHVA